jgi:hypothetical protein
MLNFKNNEPDEADAGDILQASVRLFPAATTTTIPFCVATEIIYFKYD